jgi:hypothetical protein
MKRSVFSVNPCDIIITQRFTVDSQRTTEWFIIPSCIKRTIHAHVKAFVNPGKTELKQFISSKKYKYQVSR